MKNLIIISFFLIVGLNGFGQKKDTIIDFEHSSRYFNGFGYHETLNKYYQLSKKGVFENYKFIDGLWYKYDEYNRFTKIEIYKKGSYVKDSAVIYPPLNKLEGLVELKRHLNSLTYSVVTHDMNNEPRLMLIGKDKEIYQIKLPSSDTTKVNFELLKLKDGTYHILIKDSISPRISEFFIVGKVSSTYSHKIVKK
ncbi:MAG: hypothetical protein CO118_06370 [Flavobacteriales bacterium CG_4_9_14_3_um_filter_32_8]|nr:MAG: hypothetical protein CO118_06370 [Flavobacteriales bacterium CG_4_9_14_3_um_filter_32_8]